ncbi:hypothetical protein [Streptomyces sp. NBC_01373]|uniref:hypothetical protein n=1 Tax=Streptomyces sp. NBC_01373 TaxID=2903843 RepID=UPI0022556291|nr:hypothetical protein [Streptomyces sp. NBC_01373]MCX4704388.1 hypothetical protein [Streptomyces sp. NBC_01373]MCX4707128.1 hypothetical protein [Streptomyces sp. NBC_01373]
MDRTTVEQLLTEHAIDPAALPSAPADASRRNVMHRICMLPPWPCGVCGDPSRTSRTIDTEAGPRWVDLCRDHSLAVMPPWRGPTTVEGIVADLRWAAAQLGLPLRVYTDKEGWRDNPGP